jgi:hypothetical protein
LRLSAVDGWVIGYSVFASAVALLFGSVQSGFADSHVLHVGAIIVALAVARYVPSEGRWSPFLRYGYAMPLFGLFYLDTHHYIWVFFSEWFDPALIAFEESMLGFNFTSQIARIDSPLLLDFWMFGYFFYYLMPPLAVTVMIWKRRPDEFKRMMGAVSAAFFVSYAMFFFYPLEGPRYAMVEVLPALKGIILFPLVMAIQNNGSIHGGCMPSSHTAVAWIFTYYLLLVHRSTGRFMVVISTILSVGCFWGRFHYLTDVLVGFAIFLVAIWWTERYNRRRVGLTGASATAQRGAA